MQKLTNYDKFIKNLRGEILSRNWSIRHFATLVPIARSSVYKWFTGEDVMSMKTYCKIEQLFQDNPIS